MTGDEMIDRLRAAAFTLDEILVNPVPERVAYIRPKDSPFKHPIGSRRRAEIDAAWEKVRKDYEVAWDGHLGVRLRSIIRTLETAAEGLENLREEP